MANLEPLPEPIVKLNKRLQAIIGFTPQQRTFCSTYFKTADFDKACQAAKIQPSTARGWLKERKFTDHLEARLKLFQEARGYTFEDWIGRAMDIYHGRVEAKGPMIAAGELIARALKYIQPDNLKNEINNSEVQIVYSYGNKLEDTPPPALGAPEAASNELRGAGADGGQALGKDPVRDLPPDRGDEETK